MSLVSRSNTTLFITRSVQKMVVLVVGRGEDYVVYRGAGLCSSCNRDVEGGVNKTVMMRLSTGGGDSCGEC